MLLPTPETPGFGPWREPSCLNRPSPVIVLPSRLFVFSSFPSSLWRLIPSYEPVARRTSVHRGNRPVTCHVSDDEPPSCCGPLRGGRGNSGVVHSFEVPPAIEGSGPNRFSAVVVLPYPGEHWGSSLAAPFPWRRPRTRRTSSSTVVQPATARRCRFLPPEVQESPIRGGARACGPSMPRTATPRPSVPGSLAPVVTDLFGPCRHRECRPCRDRLPARDLGSTFRVAFFSDLDYAAAGGLVDA